jgi:hypothetical protein
MNTIKSSVIALLLGTVVSNQLAPEPMPELFKLDDDKLIITPGKATGLEPIQNKFFMEDDKFIEVPTALYTPEPE